MAGRLDGKLAIVTGGNSGIGEAMVHRFATEGASVAFCGRREEPGRDVEAAVRNEGGRARFFACDVTDPAQVRAFVEEAVGALGGLDVVVSNAGTGGAHGWPDETDEEWQSILDLNLNGMFYLCRAAWPHLVARGGGSIVAITSLSGVAGIGADQLELMGGFQPSASYQASKAGMEGLMLHLAGRGGEHGIRVNAVRPGRILTRQFEQMLGEDGLFWNMYKRIQMLKTHGRAEDIAEAALYLACDESKFVTAEIIDVNGGAIGKA
ncbi:MAG: SDR family oxidoreductase [Proteobacteria bacterium]|nr:SDR family oxidoreductase [Pseudomonadota bacterium]